MLNRGVHDGAGIAVGGSENSILVAGSLGAANVANDLKVRLPLEKALPDGAGNPFTLRTGPPLDEGLQQLPAAGARTLSGFVSTAVRIAAAVGATTSSDTPTGVDLAMLVASNSAS